jgi:hypothetical protein
MQSTRVACENRNEAPTVEVKPACPYSAQVPPRFSHALYSTQYSPKGCTAMRSSLEQRLRGANDENGRVNEPGGAQVLADLLRTPGPPTPILQSEDGELVDEDSPTWPAAPVDAPG